MILKYISTYLKAFFKPCFMTCILPETWSGTWTSQQQKELFQTSRTDANIYLVAKTIDDLKFLNKGTCVNFKDERYFFYDR